VVHKETSFRYNHRNLSDILTTWLFMMHIDTSLGLALTVLMPNLPPCNELEMADDEHSCVPTFQIPVAPDDPVFGCNEQGIKDA
jgi:hypothetical protein